jgi:hypothetical protein
MKRISAEVLVSVIIAPWFVWATIGVFNSEKVQAVQEEKYKVILEKIEDIKTIISNHMLKEESLMKRR